jgi:hypothetical protein
VISPRYVRLHIYYIYILVVVLTPFLIYIYRASTTGDDNTYSAADLSARRFQTTGLSVTGGRQIFLPRPLGLCSSLLSTRPPRTSWAGIRWGSATFSRPYRCPAAGRGGWLVTVDAGTGLNSADTATGWSDPGGQRSDTGRRSDTGGQRDTGCYSLVAGGHGDTVSRPARTAGGQGT